VRIVIAPDGFKGCLSAREVCDALEAGLRQVLPEAKVIKVPIADGGDGTAAVLVEATGGRMVAERVSGPLGTPVVARFGLLGDARTAVIEMATASGLALIPPARRNPLLTSTYGTGQLVQAALDRGCREFIIGVGGSATNDAGAGVARALGVRFLDASGHELPRATGRSLVRIAHIDMSKLDVRVAASRFRVACDVRNPLYGPHGAAYVYGPQKGATPPMVEELDAGLRHFAALIEKQLGKAVADLPGAGAAGGLGAGLAAFCNATLEPGAQVVLEVVRLREKAAGADLLLTGEGRLDAQTAFGKGPYAVAQLGRELGVPVAAVAGQVAVPPEELAEWGLVAAWDSSEGLASLEEAMDPRVARERLQIGGVEVGQALLAGRLGAPAPRV
jgi:glycerate kinase